MMKKIKIRPLDKIHQFYTLEWLWKKKLIWYLYVFGSE